MKLIDKFAERLKPINQRRFANFRKNRRAVWSLAFFCLLFFITLFSELIANDRPIFISYQGHYYFPVFKEYPETTFGGDFETEAEYRDPYIKDIIEKEGWIIWAPIPYRYDTHITNLSSPAPSPPTKTNLLGTDDQARDVLARIIYGFRISVLFALALTFGTSIMGIFVGAIQGFYGGKIDLVGQRILEIWGSLPELYMLIIMASVVTPNIWWLLGIMLLFGWTRLVDLVRAEFLRGRNLEYVRAARALGVGNAAIMFKHILPNAVVATMTMVPFILAGAITALTSLDFLGFGLPVGSPSLGELIAQGKENLHAPWLGISAFVVLSLMLTLLVFIGEGVRDAFDPRLAK